jgi:acetolactate synthase-1/2/3 large subunit
MYTGSKVLLECLEKEGVEHIFGYPGGAVINIYHDLPNYSLKHILVRHEQAAVHAADGYARATGKVGVCLVTSGPGATNTVTGIATAYMDSVPLVVFSGQVPTMLIGNDAFQEADVVGMTRPCTKHSYLVKNIKDLPIIIKEAFYIANTGRKGPVLVDLPKDILGAKLKNLEYPEEVKITGYKPTYECHMRQIKKALSVILSSSKPLIYIGGGILLSDAAEELREFVKLTGIPVTSTLMGLGAYPGNDNLFLGMLGMHGTYRANLAVTECDILIAIGARFDDRVTGKIDEFAPNAKIIHIDIDPTSISKNVVVDIPIVGDAKNALKKFNNLLNNEYKETVPKFKSNLEIWYNQIDQWKKVHKLNYDKNTTSIKPQYVIEKLYEITKGDAIIATEVGQNQMWTAQFYPFEKPRTLLTSGGLGTMGYGLPAALGAQVAFPDKTVIDVAGDGSIQMNIQELATVMQYKLPVKIIILNNGYLGMVRQWQELFFDKNYSETVMEVVPDFVKLAESYGAVGFRATTKDEVVPVLKEALSIKLPVIVDFHVDREENVYPMVPAGAPISKMLLV